VGNYPLTVWAHYAGAVGGGILLGLTLTAIGLLLRQAAPELDGLAIAAVLGVAYGGHEFGLFRLPTPQRHKQVPRDWWP
jgi:hypothetical protein